MGEGVGGPGAAVEVVDGVPVALPVSLVLPVRRLRLASAAVAVAGRGRVPPAVVERVVLVLGARRVVPPVACDRPARHVVVAVAADAVRPVVVVARVPRRPGRGAPEVCGAAACEAEARRERVVDVEPSAVAVARVDVRSAVATVAVVGPAGVRVSGPAAAEESAGRWAEVRVAVVAAHARVPEPGVRVRVVARGERAPPPAEEGRRAGEAPVGPGSRQPLRARLLRVLLPPQAAQGAAGRRMGWARAAR